MDDPHAWALQPPKDDEYEDRDYNGLYVFPLDGKHYIAKMRWIRGGMGREFFDPISGEYLGFCGSFVAAEQVITAFEFAQKHMFEERPPKPKETNQNVR